MSKAKAKTQTEEELASISALKKIDEASDNWRDTVVVQAITQGIREKWHSLLMDIGSGRARNNKYNQGYMQACRDIQAQLTTIVEPTLIPEDVNDK